MAARIGPPNQRHYFSARDELAAARRLPGSEQPTGDTTLTLAGLYLSLGLPDEAERVLRDLSGKRTSDPQRARLNLARLLYQRSHLPEAAAALANLRELQAGYIKIQRDYLFFLVFFCCLRFVV